MKRFMITTALTLTTAGAAMAATEGQINTIENYLPEANVAAWSDTQVISALNVIKSGDKSRGEIEAQLKAMYVVDGENFTPAMITEGEQAMLDMYVDGVDYSMLPQPVVDQAINVAYSDLNNDQKAEQIETLLTVVSPTETLNRATEGEIALIESYVPELDASLLSEEQVVVALDIINSTDNEAEIEPRLKAYLNIS